MKFLRVGSTFLVKIRSTIETGVFIGSENFLRQLVVKMYRSNAIYPTSFSMLQILYKVRLIIFLVTSQTLRTVLERELMALKC